MSAQDGWMSLLIASVPLDLIGPFFTNLTAEML